MANYIKKHVVIVWDKKEHRIAVTNDLCNALESADINLFKMHVDMLRGGTPKVFMLSNLLASILILGAGVPVEQDDLLSKLTVDVDAHLELKQFASDFLSAVFPSQDEVEKSSAGKSKKTKK